MGGEEKERVRKTKKEKEKEKEERENRWKREEEESPLALQGKVFVNKMKDELKILGSHFSPIRCSRMYIILGV